MSSTAFKEAAAAAAAKGSKNMDRFLVGSGGNYLAEGTHDVTITATGPAVDRQGVTNENQVVITYTGEGDKIFSDRVYLMSSDGAELSLSVRLLLSSVIPNTDLIDQWMDLAVTDDGAFELFTGMKASITLKPGPGTQVRADASGKFAAYELDKKGNATKVTDDFEDIKEAKDAAAAAGYKRSFLRVTGVKCTHGEANAAAFVTAIASRKTKPAAKITRAV